MNQGIIYQYTSTDGKSYIGFTTNEMRVKYDFSRCIYRNVNKENKYFYDAVKEIGIDKFTYKIICKVNTTDKGMLRKIRNRYIKQYNTNYPNGYNATYKQTEEES